MALGKFERLAEPHATASERRAIADAVFDLEHTPTSRLMRLLEAVGGPQQTTEVERV